MEPKETKSIKKSEKPLFHDFLNRLHVIIANPDGKKDPANEAYKHIKRGFKEKVENHHIEDLCKYLFVWNYFPKLAIKIALEVNLRRSNALMEKLFRKIKIEMATRVKFPSDKSPLFTNVSSYERQKDLQNWIKVNHKDGFLDFEWARNAIICLLGKPMIRDDFHAIHALIEGCFKKKKPRTDKKTISGLGAGKDATYSSYIKLVGPLFVSDKAATSKVTFGLGMARFFIERANKLESDNHELKDIHSSLRTELNLCKDSLDARDSLLTEMSNKQEILEEEIESKNKSLTEEAARYELLDKHWQEKSGHELARQAYNFKKYFSFEIGEAILSLDSDHPDIAMALNRIRHMEEYLQKMEHVNEWK